MNKQLLNALEVCLQATKDGETLDSALARYPHLAADLRPLLLSAHVARTGSLSAVPQNAQTRSRARLLSAASRLRETRSPWSMSPTLRTAFVALAVVLFVFLGGSGLVSAASSSLPGEPLYVVKRGVESLQLSLVADPQKKAVIEQELYDLRIEETDLLLDEQRMEEVEFGGLVEAQTENGWVVSGIPVIVTAQTEFEGTVAIGAHVDVRGQTQADGSVLVERVRVEETESAEAEDSPSSGSDETTAPTQEQEDDSSSGSGGGDDDDKLTDEPDEDDD